MKKSEFKQIVQDGLDRGKNYMCVKVIGAEDPAHTVIVIPRELIDNRANDYIKGTDDDMVFKNGAKVEDVLLTSNPNDLSWFIY